MQIKQSTISWGLIFAAALVIIYLVGGILTPFIFGSFVAYFLDPIADRFEAKGCTRTTSTIIVLSMFSAVLIGVLMLFGPLFVDQVGGLIQKIPTYISQLQADHGAAIKKLLNNVQPGLDDQAQDIAMKFSNEILRISGILLTGIFTSGKAIFSIFSLVLISPVIAFYLLRDWDILVKKIDDLLPREKLSGIRKNFVKIDQIISAYIRGQLTVCLIMGVFYSINLTLVGLNYGFAIGFVTGVLSFIPYVGMAIGAITGLTVAYVQFGPEAGVLFVLAVFVFGNVIEGNIITPKLVGESVELHPAWIIFALLAGGTLLGFTGVMLAIPAAAVIGVLTRSATDIYKHSGLYLGYDDPSIQIGTSYSSDYGIIMDKHETPVFQGFEDLKPQKKPETVRQEKERPKPAKTKVANNPKQNKNKKKKKKELELKFPKPESGY